MKHIPSRVALLGTLAALRPQSRTYNLHTLARVVKAVQPDLLCAEITPDQWVNGDIERLAVEYREVLIPTCRRSDIVLVPVGAAGAPALVIPRNGRGRAARSALGRMAINELLKTSNDLSIVFTIADRIQKCLSLL